MNGSKFAHRLGLWGAKALPIFFALAFVAACAGPGPVLPESPGKQPAAVARIVDGLCEATGLQRAGSIRLRARSCPDLVSYDATLALSVDGRAERYVLRFDEHRRLYVFTPVRCDSGVFFRAVFGDVTDPQVQARLVAASQKVVRFMRFRLFDAPSVETFGPNYRVSYNTVSMAKQKRSNYSYLDPFVSFVITKRGTVTGIYWGG